jgi:hypothetical protein
MKREISSILLRPQSPMKHLTSTTAFSQKLSVGAELGAISSVSESYASTNFNNRRHTYLAGLKLNYAYHTRLIFSTG